MAQTLEMKFTNLDNKIVTFTVDNPKSPLDEEQVNQVMDEMISSEVFMTTGGPLVSKKSARIVERNITDLSVE